MRASDALAPKKDPVTLGVCDKSVRENSHCVAAASLGGAAVVAILGTAAALVGSRRPRTRWAEGGGGSHAAYVWELHKKRAARLAQQRMEHLLLEGLAGRHHGVHMLRLDDACLKDDRLGVIVLDKLFHLGR